MPMTCSILGCSSRYSKGKNIKFFRFPLKDKCRLTAWLNVIKRENWIPSKFDTVCNEHFTANDFMPCREAYKTFLRPTAVPSIFPSSTKSNKRKKYKIRTIDNENKKNKEDNIEKNNRSYEEKFINIRVEIDRTIDKDINNSHINIQSEVSYKNIENVHMIKDVIEEPNIYNGNINSNINLETCNSETAITEESCVISSMYEPMKVEKYQVNNYDNLDCLKLHCAKRSPTPNEINLRHKICMLQQKLRRRDAKIIYLRRLLKHLKQKEDILSVIQHL
ncbi:THAP domain-containing protein 5-like [Cataglyphis hispanica]|uniref:THAP domain-containing protein 5-like n=1 Tax=Cataglyphis hispanica TaxID=1086592 RepID=UPI0021808B60|nr:THAP domain-containing protein 5-like [Cataglyphis hispanica]